MFMTVVFNGFIDSDRWCGGAVLHLGVFKAHRPETGFVKKVIGGIVSYAISALVWLALYSYHYLGW